VAEQVRDDLLAAGIGRPSQHEVILPGVELGIIPSRDAARASLGITGSGPVITMMGRITGIKRPDRFAAAARLIAAERPDVTFAVAGAGDLAETLAAEVSDLPVRMLGWRDDVEAVLAASDVLVLTSDNEGTPLSLIQAGLAGVPVVATNVGAVRTVVDDSVTGLLCSTTPESVASAVISLLGDPAKATAMGDRAREAMSARFGMGRMVAEHEHLYRRLLG
jgi:glycosyltransferase involved in cell wall biosynthesis